MSLKRTGSLPTAPEIVVRLHEPLPSMLGFWLVWSCVTLVHAVTVATSLCVQWPCHVQHKLFWCMHPLLWLLQSSRDSPKMSLDRRGCVLDGPFRAEHSIPSLLAHWPVVGLFTDHQIPQKRSSCMRFYRCTVSIKMKLQASLLLCPRRRMVPLLGPVTYQTLEFLSQLIAAFY